MYGPSLSSRVRRRGPSRALSEIPNIETSANLPPKALHTWAAASGIALADVHARVGQVVGRTRRALASPAFVRHDGGALRRVVRLKAVDRG